MALVQLGPIVQAISGQIGGVVFHAGKRAGVIAKAPTRVLRADAATFQTRATLLRFIRDWGKMDAGAKAAWRAYAQAHPMVDTLGRRRPLPAHIAHLKWYMTINPHGSGTALSSTVPQGNFTPTGIITGLSFTAGGPYNVTIDAMDWTYLFELVYVQRHLEYGPRAARGSYRYVGTDLRNATTINWYSLFSAAGITLSSGEQVRIFLRWQRSNWWPSQLASADTTVV